MVLRPLRRDDARPLAELAADPSVSRWWPELDESEALKKVAGEKDAGYFAIEEDGELVGLIEFWEEPEPEYRHAGIDLFLAAGAQDRGLGQDAVTTMARHLIEDRGHHRITIDPELRNERAIACYERVGFRRVGVMRSYSRVAGDDWQDGLLLELIAADRIDS